MWFRYLSLTIAGALLAKAAIALTVPRRFYAVRQRQYAAQSPPVKLLIAPVIVVALALTAWYATLLHYRPWGWVVTGFLTALVCMAADHLFRWEQHRQRMLRVVANSRVWQVDVLLLAIGAGFLALALLVY